MKKLIYSATSWSLYYLGDLVSKTNWFRNGKYELPYLIYNWAMVKSLEIQDSAELKTPWLHK